MDEGSYLRRTKELALRILRLSESLPVQGAAGILAKQLVRSSTSVGANYRSACRAKSRADMANKLAIVEEELDETAYWLELLVEGGFLPGAKVHALQLEVNELLAITVASRRTLARTTGAAKIENRKSKIEN